MGNSPFARIRLNRSDLNLHKFSIGLSDSAGCICHANKESTIHYLTECFIYSGECQILFKLVEYYVPNFQKKRKVKQTEILLRERASII